jgi:hypothetical protein
MSQSIHVIGFRPPADARWQAMKAVADTCFAAGVQVPQSVKEFFNFKDPDPSGIEVELKGKSISKPGTEGVEVELSSLPANITSIRFYVSY